MTTEQPRPAHERLRIMGEWLVEDVGEHTCAGGTPESGYAHEPSCGMEPLMMLDELDEQMHARSRFAARIERPGSMPGRSVVALYAGERYVPGVPPARQHIASVELTDEQARDLVLVLGEPLSIELPEALRPADTWGPL